jgi:hypothetical protein
VTEEDAGGLAGVQPPEPDGRVVTRGSDDLTVRRDRHRVYPARVAMPLMDQPPLSKVPDPHYAVLAPGDQGIPMRGDPGDGTSMGDGARRLRSGPENIEPVSTGYATEPVGHARIYAGAAQRGQQGARYITTRSEAMEKVTSTGKGLRGTPGRGVWPGSAVNDVPV